MQYKLLSKLLGYDFLLENRKGSEGRVTDASSRKMEEEMVTLSLIYALAWDLL